jgi:ribosomal protein L29
MANQQADQARRWDDERLAREINDAYRAMFTLRFRMATGRQENYRELRSARQRIARLRTIRRERELAAYVGSEE